MAGSEVANLTDKVPAVPNAVANTESHTLSNLSLTDYKSAMTAMTGNSLDSQLLGNFSLTDTTGPSTGAKGADTTGPRVADTSSAKTGDSGGQRTGAQVDYPDNLTRTSEQLSNVKSELKTAVVQSDQLKAAGVLSANGINTLEDGKRTFDFNLSKDYNVTLKTTQADGSVTDASGKISKDGSELITDKGAGNKQGDGKSTDNQSGTKDSQPPVKETNIQALFDPKLSQEAKIKIAQEMAHQGQTHFKGPDGKDYQISDQKYGSREGVSLFQSDGKGHSHVMLRGIVDANGQVEHQKNSKGQDVDYGGTWAQKNEGTSTLLRHDEKQQQNRQGDQGGGQGQGQGDKGNGQGQGDKGNGQGQGDKGQGDKGDKGNDGSDKTQDSAQDAQKLEASRKRLQQDVETNIPNPADRQRFLDDMNKFEQRSKTQPLATSEVSNTYDQLSRLLEAKDGAVPPASRQLAAETFANHMASPADGIDQGNHKTCNVTTLEEHLITRSPSKAAEMMSTIAINGNWTAPDGKEIKIDPRSLVPGVEERTNPPQDGSRSYATQLLNLGLVNDVTQRRTPPEYYSQERPDGAGDTGERLRYADGKEVTNNDMLHNGDQSFARSPYVWSRDINNEGTRMNGDSNFVIANGKSDNSEGLAKVNSAQELGDTLAQMKQNGKMPAILLVDGNNQIFYRIARGNQGRLARGFDH